MMIRVRFLLAIAFCLAGCGGNANAQTGQTAFGQVTLEPAVNYKDGSTVFLEMPDRVSIPVNSNPIASSPIYLPMFPTSSTVSPNLMHCQPSNCDHLPVLPFPAPGYANGGASCVQYGLPANGCSLILGHDHLIGLPQGGGESGTAWQVVLVVFTPAGIAAGAANHKTLTLMDLATLISMGYAFEAATPVSFRGAIVPAANYYRGTPRTF